MKKQNCNFDVKSSLQSSEDLNLHEWGVDGACWCLSQAAQSWLLVRFTGGLAGATTSTSMRALVQSVASSCTENTLTKDTVQVNAGGTCLFFARTSPFGWVVGPGPKSCMAKLC